MFNPFKLYRISFTLEKVLQFKQINNSTSIRCFPNLTTIRGYVRPSCELCQSDPNEKQLKQNTYYEKYKGKLQKLAKVAPEVYNAKLNELNEEKEQVFREHKKDLSTPPTEKKSSSGTGILSWPPKELNDLMKVELLADKFSTEIEQIWVEHFVKKDCVFAVLKEPHVQFDQFLKRSKDCPLFIYPLPRQDGYEFYLSQFKEKEVYFTPLIHYQKHQENAPPCLSIAHFTDFQHSKGLVLMAGMYDDQILSKEEALNLVRQMSQYYGNRTPENFQHVKLFNHQPDKFDHSKLISQYKMMQSIVESELPI